MKASRAYKMLIFLSVKQREQEKKEKKKTRSINKIFMNICSRGTARKKLL